MNAVKVDEVTKVFGGRIVLESISFEVRKGHIHGLLGPNGAGKTTTLRILSNLLRADAGKVQIFDTTLNSDHRKVDTYTHRKIGFLLDEAPLYGEMTVYEYLSYVGRLRGVSESDIIDNMNYCLEKLDLNKVSHRSIENLSQGYMKRVGIAQALIHKPELVVLDEPTANLDPKSVVEIRNLILDLRKNHTVIVSSHLLHEMSIICDDLTIISDGRIRGSGTLSDLRKRIEGKSEITLILKERNEDFVNYLIDREDILDVDLVKIENNFVYKMHAISPDHSSPEIVKKAVEMNLSVIGIENNELSLEEVFMRVIEK